MIRYLPRRSRLFRSGAIPARVERLLMVVAVPTQICVLYHKTFTAANNLHLDSTPDNGNETC
jgi:hypothetical protein